MGRPASTPVTLQLAATHISSILKTTLKIPSHACLPAARPNVKWSKISINSVPTSVSSRHTAYTPVECHNTLITTNPTYAQLTVMQRPSWVCPPSSYSEGTTSSLSVVFEDPDGSKLKMMLAEHYLYIFSTRATVKRWKHHLHACKDTAKNPAAQHTTDNDSALEDNKEEVIMQLTQLHTTEHMQMHNPQTSTPPPTTGSFSQTSPHHTSFDTWLGETTGHSEHEEDNIFLNLDKEQSRQQAQEDSLLSTPQPLPTTQREQPA
jgi:hypothetical protein